MQVDIIVTTALIPGKPAPKLITTGMVESMKPGSVIVDLAAEQGGNCALTEPGKVVHHKGVTIVGYTDLPSRMASMSSQLYGSRSSLCSKNLIAGRSKRRSSSNVRLSTTEGRLAVRSSLHEGKMMWPPPLRRPPHRLNPAFRRKHRRASPSPKQRESATATAKATGINPVVLAVVGLVLLGIGYRSRRRRTLSHFTVFMLACFVGFQVVWNVKPALHTPLMSVTNAISGIILVGGMLQLISVID